MNMRPVVPVLMAAVLAGCGGAATEPAAQAAAAVAAAPPAATAAQAGAPGEASGQAPKALVASWRRLGREHQQLSVPAGTTVRYGANGNYVQKVVSGAFQASNGFFGADPAPGMLKAVDRLVQVTMPDAAAVTGAPGAVRGIPSGGPWVSYYGDAEDVDLARMAATFRVIDIDADPGLGNFTPAQIAALKAQGRNKVLSYLNLGACERFRTYWDTAPAGLVPCGANAKAQRGAYEGYPDETWMTPADPDYQRLILEHVAPRLVAQGVDGFYLDNLEIVEHGTQTANGPCGATCSQGGLDLVYELRRKYPNLTIVMQNATGERTRTGSSNGVPFALLIDGIAREEVYKPRPDAEAQAELARWAGMGLAPGGVPFWVGTLDYVGGCGNAAEASAAYAPARARGFSPYVADASAGLQAVCYWPF